MRSVLKDTPQFYSPDGEWYCFAVLFAYDKWYCASHSLKANKISLKPKALITLLIYQKYHYIKLLPEKEFFSSSGSFVLIRTRFI